MIRNAYLVNCCTARRKYPADSLKHVKVGRGFCTAAQGFSTAWSWESPELRSPAAVGTPVARVAPRSGGSSGSNPPRLLVDPPNPHDAPMLARSARMRHFTVLVPISRWIGYDAEPDPGVWPCIDAFFVVVGGRHWAEQTEEEKEEKSAVLWRCFNAIFPPATAEDAAAWAAEKWYEPRAQMIGSTVVDADFQGVEFVCQSVDGCVVEFRFNADVTHVQVSYRGPVRFSLAVAEAAQVRGFRGRRGASHISIS
jgi:hypothetical protein